MKWSEVMRCGINTSESKFSIKFQRCKSDNWNSSPLLYIVAVTAVPSNIWDTETQKQRICGHVTFHWCASGWKHCYMSLKNVAFFLLIVPQSSGCIVIYCNEKCPYVSFVHVLFFSFNFKAIWNPSLSQARTLFHSGLSGAFIRQ